MTNATLTREISIKCAHCKGRHGSVAEIRTCSTKSMIKAQPVTEPGMYRRDGDVFLVVTSKNDQLYAKKLVTTMQGNQVHKLAFEYDKGSIFTLQATDRMTLEDVAKLGQTTGHCWVCARKLTVQKSIKVGIGPVCAKKV